ncbi:MAG: pre-16S rRNA-processing nuclease YqgF [Armatimonadetes bacterium]|nr:pre-16S rRNA-processing nuclease YqgF [Armatimonadota bacterium]NIO97834.1 pre-16S rRNA-processing nuclease YqgF [Armatimonadota bacterium]
MIDAEQGVLYQAVVATDGLPDLLLPLVREKGISRLVLGDRTGTEELVRRLRAAGIKMEIILVDEHRSTEEGRRRFFAENPPVGWKRFLPRSLLFPDRPYDDYVAIILAERHLSSQTGGTIPQRTPKQP